MARKDGNRSRYFFRTLCGRKGGQHVANGNRNVILMTALGSPLRLFVFLLVASEKTQEIENGRAQKFIVHDVLEKIHVEFHLRK